MRTVVYWMTIVGAGRPPVVSAAGTASIDTSSALRGPTS